MGLTMYEKSAIIGHWRMGATIFEIAGMVDVNTEIVEKIIEEYNKQIDDE